MDILVTFAAIILAGIVAATIWIFLGYNRLRALETRCQMARDDIDVQLKLRSDLLPNITETVKAYVGQENKYFDTLMEIQREQNASASIQNKAGKNANIQNSLTGLFSSLATIPELHSSGHYQNLRRELIDIENRISASRRFLNLATNEFNAYRMQFPGSLFARELRIYEQRGYNLDADRVFHEDAPVLKL